MYSGYLEERPEANQPPGCTAPCTAGKRQHEAVPASVKYSWQQKPDVHHTHPKVGSRSGEMQALPDPAHPESTLLWPVLGAVSWGVGGGKGGSVGGWDGGREGG